MYFPYMRGKQNELITVRETAAAMAQARFVPIISPVREQMRGLHKALEAVCDADGRAVLIINPEHGELSNDGTPISSLLNEEFKEHQNLLVGIRLHSDLTVDQAREMCKKADKHDIALIHAGFKDANAFAANINEFKTIRFHVFLEDDCGKLYQRNFKNKAIQRILIRDGFERRRNRDHPETEFFSDLHITYEEEEGINGFGDFLIVGDEYSESGGPAYTIAIHLTYIDPDQDNAMYLLHFLSDRQDTPKDPAGKFGEALAKLIQFLDGSSGYKVYETSAINEFRELHERQHYPGLGYLKKLSMKHHIESLIYFKNLPPENA